MSVSEFMYCRNYVLTRGLMRLNTKSLVREGILQVLLVR